MIKGISVQELFKAEETEDLKLAVIRHAPTFADESVSWATDQVVRQVRQGFPELAVSDQALTSYKIVSYADNDPEGKNFHPDDQFPLIYDVLRRADIVIIGCRESCGLPDSRVVRMIERLAGKCREKQQETSGGPVDHRLLFMPKALAVVVVGGSGACAAARLVAGALNKFGLIPAPKGAVGWDEDGGENNVYKDADFAACLGQLGDNLLQLAKAIK